VLELGTGGSTLSDMTITNGYIYADGQDFIVGKIKFNNTGSTVYDGIQVFGIVANTHPTGVIHSCQFINTTVLVFGSYNTMDSQAAIWALPYPVGDQRKMVYIEGNTFTKSIAGVANVIDGSLSARTVLRYNTIITTPAAGTGATPALYIEAHSVQGDANRGYQRWEYYNNTIDNQAGSHFVPYRVRAGTGVVFNNITTGLWGSNVILYDNVRSYESRGTSALKCDGTSLWDGNYDATGYPCRDQIGRGYDASQWEDAPPGAYTQVLMPAYSWNNTGNSNANVPASVSSNSSQHIQANRDFYDYNVSFNGTSGVGKGLLSTRPVTCTTGVAYFATDQGTLGTLYKCTATDTWTPYFTPYTCPHPLAGLTGSCTSAAGTAGYNVGSKTQPAQSTLLVTSDNGTVTSNPAGINCGSTCSENYGAETSVTLTASANSGYTFIGWSGGGCSGTGACTVTMTEAKSVTAQFATSVYNLTVAKSGTGAGTVTGSDGLINCGSICSVNYASGTSVILTASPNSGYTFTGWSGACSGTGTCTVSMTEAKSVAATFIPVYKLTVTKSVSGAGTITSSDSTINCGSTCSANYNPGTSVTLTASPNSGYTFTGWSGGGCSGTGTCTVAMTTAASVTATFATTVYNLTVTKPGTGAGTVTGSDGLINCGSTCSVNYESGTSVALAASATSGSTFSGWSGGCTGTGICTVNMTAAKSVKATFAKSLRYWKVRR
jgi:uncharacterized repeat protein (TIGR02543 family)